MTKEILIHFVKINGNMHYLALKNIWSRDITDICLAVTSILLTILKISVFWILVVDWAGGLI